MELYNFFTEVTSDKEKIEEMKSCLEELKPICKHVEMVLFTGFTGEKRYSIIGQIYGDDTNVGDTSLLSVFYNIKYTWFDAFCPSINNIKDNAT